MKRLIIFVIIFAAVCALGGTPVVYATESYPVYAKATVKNAYFFQEKNTSSSLFAVPYTYCIEILGDEGEWYRARYASDTGIYKALTGYCRKTDFTEVEGVPQVTYLYKTVTVSYSAGETGGSLPVLNEISIEAAYYGTYDSGAAVYSYVYCQGSFGYIEGANDDYPLNLDEADDDLTDGEQQSAKESGISAGLISVIVIAVLFTGVAVMLYFITRRNRTD